MDINILACVISAVVRLVLSHRRRRAQLLCCLVILLAWDSEDAGREALEWRCEGITGLS